MKRTFDNSVLGGSASYGTSGQISTGQMATKDSVYQSTNMVCIQNDDHTEIHGIQTQFNQTRVLPIVGKTSRAEIALKSADVQTKSLPILQPQVKIDSNPLTSDIDRLIYEVGLSATWRNSVLELPVNGSTLSSLAETGPVQFRPYPNTVYVERDNDFTYWGESTFMNVPNASIQLIDSYNSTETVTLFPTAVTNTSLVTLFNYFRGFINPVTVPGTITSYSSIRNTCLTPVVVPSVKADIINAILPSGTDQYAGDLLIFVDTLEGFSIGDRIRLFGVRDLTNVLQPLVNTFATVKLILPNYSPVANGPTNKVLVVDYAYDLPTYPSPSFGLTTPTYASPSFAVTSPVFSSPSFGLILASNPSSSFGLDTAGATLTFNLSSTVISRYPVGTVINVTGSPDPRVNGTYTIIRINGNTQIVVPSAIQFPVQVTTTMITAADGFSQVTFNVDNTRFVIGERVGVTGATDPRINGNFIVNGLNGSGPNGQIVVNYPPSLTFPIVSSSSTLTLSDQQAEVYFNVADNSVFAVNDVVLIAGSPDPRVNGEFTVVRLNGGTQIVIDNNSLSFPPAVSSATTITIEGEDPKLTFNVADNTPFAPGTEFFVTGSPDPRINQQFTVLSRNGGTQIVCNAPNLSFPVASTPTLLTILIGDISFEDGYAINLRVQDGGHIEFLTDEQEFEPLFLNGGFGTGNGTITLFLDPSSPALVLDSGFWRGFIGNVDVHPMNAAVELLIVDYATQPSETTIRALSQTYNGYYTIVSRTTSSITLCPIAKSIPGGGTSLTGVQFKLSLAPNFYTFDTRADEVFDPLTTINRMNFMRSLGYLPSDDLIIGHPTTPPTASIPAKTWTRAYTVDWNFSAYRNITWLTQDTTATKPRLPLQFQDFGVDNGSSTYYNVYEMNKFINDSVNPAIDQVITDTEAFVQNFESFSLNGQLGLCFNAYKQLFSSPASAFVWSPVGTYVLGSLAVSGTSSSSLAFMCARTSPLPDALPTTPISTLSWVYLGTVPYQVGESTPYALVISQIVTPATIVTTAGMVNYPTIDPLDALPITLSFTSITTPSSSFNNLILQPVFTSIAPKFNYNNLTLLMALKYDGYGFGTINVVQPGVEQQTIALLDYGRISWGNQGSNNADEWITLESNTSFKFLFDNFPSYCIAYEDTLGFLHSGESYPFVHYWIWDSTTLTDPRTDGQFYEIYQTSESLSACMSPVESIVVVSENIPVLEELASPAFYLVDSDTSAFFARNETVSLTQKIIGEIPLYHFSPYNARSVIRYDANELHFCALLDTKTFKQLEYSLYYRHRITQQLVPLILTNYGSVNIKFVFRPIS